MMKHLTKRLPWSLTSGLALLALVVSLGSTDVVVAKEKKKDRKKKVVNVLPEPVSPRQSIRFYKVNKQIQADRILITDKKASSAGCQNFLKKVRVHRAVQIGFLACTLYEKKDCDDRYIVVADTEKDPRRSSLLTEGKGWYTASDNERGATVGSWSCSTEVTPDQLSYETRLANREVKRLKKISRLAARRAAEAQKKADKARKSAKDAKDQANGFKELALAAGVEFIEDLKEGEVIKSSEDDEEDEDGNKSKNDDEPKNTKRSKKATADDADE